MYNIVVIVIAAVLSVSVAAPAASAEPLNARWLDLWTRCRVAVEQAVPVDHTGLKYLGSGPDSLGRQSQTWDDPNSIFELREGQWGDQRRDCEVAIKEGQWPGDSQGLVALIGTFENERFRLVEATSHTLRFVDGISDYAAAVGPTTPNPNGFWVISTLFVGVAGRWFVSGTGEQDRRVIPPPAP